MRLSGFFQVFMHEDRLFSRTFRTLFIDFRLINTSGFTRRRTGGCTTFDLFFRRFTQRFRDLFFITARALYDLTARGISFTISRHDQCISIIDFCRAFSHLELGTIASNTLRLTLRIFARFDTRAFCKAVFGTRAFSRFYDRFQRFALFGFLRISDRFHYFAFRIFYIMFFQRNRISNRLFTDFITFSAIFGTQSRAALTRHRCRVEHFATFRLFTICEANRISNCTIFYFGDTIFFFPNHLLFARDVRRTIGIDINRFGSQFFGFSHFRALRFGFQVGFGLCEMDRIFARLMFTQGVDQYTDQVSFFFGSNIGRIATRRIARGILTCEHTVALDGSVR